MKQEIKVNEKKAISYVIYSLYSSSKLKKKEKKVWPANNAIGGVRHVAGGLVLAVVPVE